MEQADGVSTGLNVVGEMYERGFTLVPSKPSDELLNRIAELSAKIHRGIVDPTTGKVEDDGVYGLASNWHAQTDNEAACVVSTSDGFSFLRVTGSFLRNFTTLCGTQMNVPAAKLNDSSMIVGDISELIPRAYDHLGNLSFMMPLSLDQSAEVLKSQVELIAELCAVSFELATQLGIQDIFSPSSADKILLEFPLYQPGSVVDNATSDLPVHRHDEPNETVVSVKLNEGANEFVAGTNDENLEVVTQSQGEVIAMDSRVLHGAVTSQDPRLSVIFVARGADAREKMHRGLDKLARATGWEPTSVNDRELFAAPSMAKGIEF